MDRAESYLTRRSTCILATRNVSTTADAPESLTGATARGGIYVLIRRMIANAVRIGAIAVLARKLTPEEFGVVALAVMSVSLLAVFGSGGVITYIVCDRDEDWETRVHPAFWLNLALTTGSCIVVVAFLPLVDYVYDQPRLIPALLLVLADYFIRQLKSVPEALLQRQLQFRVLAMRDTARDFTSAAVGVGMALAGFGVWSLVVPNLVIAPFDVLFTAWRAKWRPRLPLGREHWPRIFKFTKNVMAEGILMFVGNESDNAIIGKVMGAAVLGVYNLAYQLSNLIGRNVSAVLAMVSTPALAAARARNTGLGPPYRRMMRVLSLATTPLLLGLFVLANELVLVVYGPKWLGAVPLLRLFILATLVRSVTSPSGAIFSVIGRPEVSVKIVLWFVALYIPALLVASRFGLVEFAITVTAARMIVGFVSLYMSLDLIDESRVRVTLELGRSFLAGILMALLAWGCNVGLTEANVSIPARIALVSAVGVVTFLVLARLIAKRALDETVSLIKQLVRRKKRARAEAA
jgi:O-antigen/teichoic acid export membrane protein